MSAPSSNPPALAMPRVQVFERWLEWMTLQDAVWLKLNWDPERIQISPLCLWASEHGMGEDLDNWFLYRITTYELEGDDELDDDPFCRVAGVGSVSVTDMSVTVG